MLKEVPDLLNSNSDDFSVLDDVIDTLRFRGSIFFHSSLAAPWGMALSKLAAPRFHIALQGDFYIGAADRQLSVKQMGVVMIPGGDGHWIADQVGRELMPSERASAACDLGLAPFQEGEVTNRIMCGLVEYDDAISHPITSALPPIFQLSDIHDTDSIWQVILLIDDEIQRCGSKQNTVIDRLTEVLFIKLLNRYVSENEHLSGFLAALDDPRIGTILQMIHKAPEHPWTLDSISGQIGMSRATLQRHFKSAMGVSPMAYVGQWRMARAYHLLRYSSLSLEKIAEATGFSDARTLSRAFQKHYGFTPSALRRKDVA